jgi:hypothetical protein
MALGRAEAKAYEMTSVWDGDNGQLLKRDNIGFVENVASDLLRALAQARVARENGGREMFAGFGGARGARHAASMAAHGVQRIRSDFATQ